MAARLQSILVGVSLTPESDRVVRAGLALAAASGAKVHLLHVLPAAELLGGAFGYEWIQYQAVEQLKDDRRQLLEARLGEVRAPAVPGFALVEQGAPHRALLDAARRLEADLLVVGAAEGKTAIDRLLGSTADRVLRRSTCPVLVVRGDLPVPLQRVVMPVDLSPLSAEAFAAGRKILAAFGALPKAEALFVLSQLQRELAYQFTPVQMERFATEELRRFVERPGGAGDVELTVRTGEPQHEILRELGERPADLVLLGTHGRGGFERFLLGSVAADVVRAAPCSALVVPPQAAREAERLEQHETVPPEGFFRFG